MAARLGKTIAFVTHDLREALLLGTRIALLDAGRLAGVYSPQEFLRATEPEARAFVESIDAGQAGVAGNAGDADAPPIVPNSGGEL